MIRKNKIKNYWGILAVAGLVLFLCFPGLIQAAGENKRVLFISSYSENFPSVPLQLKGIQSSLDQGVSLDIEYMDTKRLDTDENKTRFYEILSYKLKHVPVYDAIIVGDDNALQFAMDHHNELFPQIPVIFFGINDWERGRKAVENPYFAGTFEKFSNAETIKIAQKFNPKATKVVAIVDSTLTGQGDQSQFWTTQPEFPELEYSVLNVSDYTFDEYGKILESLDQDVILLFLSMNQDKTGSVKTLSEEFAFLKAHTHIPIYRTSIGGVGEGILGGKLIDYEAFGRISGNLVMEVLSGTPVSSIGYIEDTPYFYIFDYELIKKYNISENLIPADAVLINKEESVFEKYRELILGVCFVMAFLLIVSFILVFDNLKRRAIQKDLEKSNQSLQKFNDDLARTEEKLRHQNEVIRKNADEIAVLNQKYAIATEITDSAVWEYDLDSEEITVSENFSQIVNKPVRTRENIHALMAMLMAESHRNELLSEIEAYLKGEKLEINIQVPIENGSEGTKWILIRGKGITRNNESIKQFHGILMDTTKMKEQEEYIEYFATHDYLTKLPNRLSFLERLSEVLTTGRNGAVLLFDIDNFKEINDTRGHVYGDKLLKEIAMRLTGICNENMFISRLGGDEFLVLLDNMNSKNEIEVNAKNIQNTFEEAYLVDGKTNFINISMGITCFPQDSADINQIIMNADTAMYHVKHQGKNNYVFYHQKMKTEINTKIEIEEILRDAIKENGFKLVYQPQIDLVTGEVHGFEALLRLKNHFIRPDQFIPIAEETGLIIKIGRWVVTEAIAQLVRWRSLGLDKKAIAINYSSKQLRDREFVTELKKLVSKNQIEPDLIEIEITESILLENNRETLVFLHELKDAGFRIALDDFGTGYSSLNYLTYIPVDKVKLDKSINDKFLKLKDNSVMDSLISLAHSLELEITAEGIEEWEQFLQLKAAGCDYIQGYLFSKPLDSEEAQKIFSQNFVESAGQS